MNCLVVGGAGYVGSHVAACLREAQHQVWVYDNLSTGHAAAVPSGWLIEGDLLDRPRLIQTLQAHEIECVLHFAACTLTGESVSNPASYYQNNIVGSLALLDSMRAAGVWRLVFSSTTAIYGEPATVPITESSPPNPVNPYGFTKWAIERAISDYAAAYGIGAVVLRYFNAAGARQDGSLGENHQPETHLIPLALQVALGKRDHLDVFGADYPTPDGTCIRDYVHVDDLAVAHRRALEVLQPARVITCNLGSGTGHSVRQVLACCELVTGQQIPIRWAERRAGDAPCLIADIRLAKQILGWEPCYSTLDQIVSTAWNWHRQQQTRNAY